MQPSTPSVAVLSTNMLGASLIDVLLAQHLADSGLEVTLFSNVAAGLDALIAGVSCLPRSDDLAARLDEHDLVLIDWDPQAMGELLASPLRRKIIILNPQWHRHILEREGLSIPAPDQIESDHPVLARLLAHWDRLEYLTNDSSHLIDGVLRLCREDLGIDPTHRELRLEEALGAERRSEARVVLCPTSAAPKRRSWAPRKFVRLARALRGAGFEPHVCVAPQEGPEWRERLQGEFPLTAGSLMEAATLLAGARLFIGNDSGLGHLASAVGTATLTIYVKPPSNLVMWRPGWARGEVLVPKLRLWPARAHRRSLLSVKTAAGAALAMLAEAPGPSPLA